MNSESTACRCGDRKNHFPTWDCCGSNCPWQPQADALPCLIIAYNGACRCYTHQLSFRGKSFPPAFDGLLGKELEVNPGPDIILGRVVECAHRAEVAHQPARLHEAVEEAFRLLCRAYPAETYRSMQVDWMSRRETFLSQWRHWVRNASDALNSAVEPIRSRFGP